MTFFTSCTQMAENHNARGCQQTTLHSPINFSFFGKVHQMELSVKKICHVTKFSCIMDHSWIIQIIKKKRELFLTHSSLGQAVGLIPTWIRTPGLLPKKLLYNIMQEDRWKKLWSTADRTRHLWLSLTISALWLLSYQAAVTQSDKHFFFIRVSQK